ncbi:DUF3324 domain-containing protein [Aerococcus urinaeequi]|uniref:DUF3324 domain-containing protein n=1 Tax=Aerococcus urinaeequi TaxID=51665 RepID=UPI003D6A9900
MLEPGDTEVLQAEIFNHDDESDQNEESVQINNKYAYVIGLQVTEYEDQETTSNLNLTGIEPSLVNYRTAVVAKLQNDQPFILGNVDIEAEVYDAYAQEAIKTATLEATNFAPNSTINFVIDWENKFLDPGDYRQKLTALNDHDEWTWDEPFTITDEQAEISDDAVELESRWFTPQAFIAIIVVLVIIIIILLIVLRKRKK